MHVIVITVWLFLSNGGFVIQTQPVKEQSPEVCMAAGQAFEQQMIGKQIAMKDGTKLTVEDAGFNCAEVTKRPTI